MAYFIMCVLAAQAGKIIPYDTASGLIANIIYSVLFFVETLSIAENFIEAGVEEFQWFKRFSNKKLKEMCEDDDPYNYNNNENYGDYGGDNNEQPPV